MSSNPIQLPQTPVTPYQSQSLDSELGQAWKNKIRVMNENEECPLAHLVPFIKSLSIQHCRTLLLPVAEYRTATRVGERSSSSEQIMDKLNAWSRFKLFQIPRCQGAMGSTVSSSPSSEAIVLGCMTPASYILFGCRRVTSDEPHRRRHCFCLSFFDGDDITMQTGGGD